MYFFESKKLELFFSIPTLVIVFALIVVPFFGMIIFALLNITNTSTDFMAPYQILCSWIFWKSMIKTFFISTCASSISVLLAIPLAYYMVCSSDAVKMRVITLMVTSFCTNFLIRLFSWKLLLHPDGLIKGLLHLIGLVSSDQVLLYHTGAVILVATHFAIPLAILPIYSASEDFEMSTIESASDLGASNFQSFIKIFIPCIRDGIFRAYVLVFLTIISSPVFSEVIGGASCDLIGNKIVRKFLVEKSFIGGCLLSSILSSILFLSIFVFYSIHRKISSIFD